MNNSVIIKGDDEGNVIAQSSNPEYGYLRVEQEALIFKNGWARVEKRSALIQGKFDLLTKIGYSDGQAIPGKIVVKENLIPTNPKNSFQDIKKAGTVDVVCKVGDEPIYRKSYYTEDMSDFDVFLQHTNGDEIKEAIATGYNSNKIARL